jgi:hypothetical protein
MLSDTLDLMVTGRSKNSAYPNKGMEIGIDTRRENSVSLDLNWQPSTATAVYGYATWQAAPQGQTYIATNAYNSSNCTAATLAGCNAIVGGTNSIYGVVPGVLTNGINYTNIGGLTSGLINGTTFFHYNSKDTNAIIGLGLAHTTSFARFDANYQYTRTRTSIDFVRYNSQGVVVASPTPANAGTGAAVNGPGGEALRFTFPDMQYDRQQLNLGVTIPVDARINVRGAFMYDHATVADWHYDGLSTLNNATGAGRLYVDGGPAQSYNASTVTLMLQYKL